MDSNQFLKQVEKYLSDLNITQKSKILSELSEELEVEDLSFLDPLTTANQKRISLGLAPYSQKQRKSFASLLVKAFVVLTIVFVIFISFLIHKFTPLFKIDEKNERVTILGGLIDIDGKSGKLKIAGDVQFTDAKYNNSFDLDLDVAPSVNNINFDLGSGNYTFETSSTEKLHLNCKLSSPPLSNIIQEKPQTISIDLRKYLGSCKVKIPKGKFVNIEADEASVNLLKPEYNVAINLDNGTVEIAPKSDVAYDYALSIENGGHIGQFESLGGSAEYNIDVKIDNGTIRKIKN